MSDEAPIEELKAIAHPLRFRILQILREGELNVGEIEEASGIGQPTLSQQLGILRKAGLVETRREAKLVYYCVNKDRLSAVVEAIVGDKVLAPAQQPIVRAPSPGAANFARLS